MSSKDYDRLSILDKGTIDEMIRAEVNRLINRSFNNDRFKGDYSNKIDGMVNLIMNIYNRSNVGDIYKNHKDNFMDLLYILSFLVGEVYHVNRD